MKKFGLTVVIAAILILAGCSATRVRTDYDPRSSFRELRTYKWMPQPVKSPGNAPALYNPLLENRIHHAVDGELAGRGYRRITAGTPDFRLAYYVAAQPRTEIVETDAYYSYYHRYGFGSSVLTLEYVQGTLVIDIYHGGEDRLLWRGWASRSLDKDPDPEAVEKYVRKAVRKILKDFPPPA
ncbi:MAG: DUF4136 domain-containing protein [Candidatus Krumholzibacteriia bacterium]